MHGRRGVGSGITWSFLNNVVGRLGTLLTGIIVVRILSPEDYGTYAVGMVVLTVLLSMNELGVSVAIVQRSGSVDRIGPTVVTLAAASSAMLAAAAFASAGWFASALNAPQATGLIRLLLLGVVIDGLVAVPNALITREFQQRKRLVIDTVAFAVTTPIVITLAATGAGAWSLGWAAVAGNTVTAVLAVLWAPARYRPGWDRGAAGEVLRFGLPLAGASFLLFLMLNVDYVVVGHVLGPTQLGMYLLAFNISSWPISVVSTAVRRVTLPAFARLHAGGDSDGQGFQHMVGFVLAAVIPVCALLSVFAHPVITVLYGTRWAPAAHALEFLAVLGVGRVAVELVYDYLTAVGRTRPSLWLHLAWLIALVPALTIGAKTDGIVGVAVGHAVVVVVVLVPLLAILLRNVGVSPLATLRTFSPALIGAAAIVVVGLALHPVLRGNWTELIVGGLAASIAYLILALPMRRSARAVWNTRF